MTISTSTLTDNVATSNGVVTGDGVFDDLMETVNTHLENQFQLGRITGTDYATVYLGALQSTIQQSVQFTLNKATANAQVSLTDKQALTEVAKELLVDAQTSTEGSKKLDIENQTTNRTAAQTTNENNAVKQRLLHVAQTSVETNRATLVANQATAETSRKSLLDSQELHEDAKKLLTDSQKGLIDKQQTTEDKKALDVANQTTNRSAAQTTNENNAVKQRLLHVAQTSLANSQTEATTTDTVNKKLTTKAELRIAEQKLITEKLTNGEELNQYIWEVEYNENVGKTYTLTTIQNYTPNDVSAVLNADPHVPNYTVKTVTLNQVNNLRHKGDSLPGAEIQKALEEVAVLKQKAITEYAQTEVTTQTSPAAASIIGRQTNLYQQQANGFEWDAKNSYNKNITDLLKIQINTVGDFNASDHVTIKDLLEPFATDNSFVKNS